MFKTIFGKIMALFIVIIMISLYISGALISSRMRETYLWESEAQLVRTLDDLEQWAILYNDGTVGEEWLAERIYFKAQAETIAVWAIRGDGKVLVADNAAPEEVTQETIKQYYNDMLTALERGERVKMVVEEENFFNTPVMTVAGPAPHSGEATQYIYIFEHKRLSALNAPLFEVYRSIVLAIAIAAVLATALTYVFTRNMLRPLTIVTRGAKQLARGHFDIWLEVRSKDEIGQLADTFNAVARDLKRNQQTQDSFVANVSHELRSPLTSIQGLAQGIMDGTIPKNEARHYLDVVLDETKRMNVLINDLLDLAKIDSGQFPLQLQTVEVNETVRRILITFEAKIDVKNLMVEAEFAHDREPAEADENRLIQVLQNLIDNAVKFADYGGRLRISTRSSEKSVIVSVNNSGEPIPRAAIPYLFDRFYKGDESRTRAKEGTGIGLSIVKKILEEHRQRVWVESDVIGGTTFSFTLNKAKDAIGDR